MPKLIKLEAVIDDAWLKVPAGATLQDVPAQGPVLVPLALWKLEREALLARGEVGVWIAPADNPGDLAPDLDRLTVIAVDFPKFGDGRGYSSGRLLRERYGFGGELRAIGDIVRDHYFFLRECGFDAFAVRPDRDPEHELEGLHQYERTYASSVRHSRPWFRARSDGRPGDASVQ